MRIECFHASKYGDGALAILDADNRIARVKVYPGVVRCQWMVRCSMNRYE